MCTHASYSEKLSLIFFYVLCCLLFSIFMPFLISALLQLLLHARPRRKNIICDRREFRLWFFMHPAIETFSDISLPYFGNTYNKHITYPAGKLGKKWADVCVNGIWFSFVCKHWTLRNWCFTCFGAFGFNFHAFHVCFALRKYKNYCMHWALRNSL